MQSHSQICSQRQMNPALYRHQLDAKYMNGNIQNKSKEEMMQIIVDEKQENIMKKYKSEQYGLMDNQQYRRFNESNQIQLQKCEDRLPKLLMDKLTQKKKSERYDNINYMLLGNHTQKRQEAFRTVLNQIYVVPYKIDQEVRTYVYSLPVKMRREAANGSRSNKQIQHKCVQIDRQVPRHTYLPNNPQPTNKQRPVQKSQQKYNNAAYINDKNVRSNSIQCKSKHNMGHYVGVRCDNQEESMRQGKLISKMIKSGSKIIKSQSKTQDTPRRQIMNRDQIIFQCNDQIIFKNNLMTYCCGEASQPQPNKINFLPKSKLQLQHKSNIHSNTTIIDITHVNSYQRSKGNVYKINAIRMIKHLGEQWKGEQKKGIRLTAWTVK